MFIGQKHKKRFLDIIKELNKSDRYFSKKFLSALYVITSDEFLWNISKEHINHNHIDFKSINIRGINNNSHQLLQFSKGILLENEMLIQAALKYNRIVQVGNQRRSFPNVIKAMEEIKSGSIGKVRYAKSWYVNNRPSIGTGKVVPVPDYLDWDLWQGPAPRVADFKDNFIHYNWHWFWNWGTGEALNNGTHFVDILRWGLGVDYPTKVDSIGGRYRFQDDWQTPDTQLITFQFGDEASFSWEGRSCNTMPVDGYGVGTAFYGETGTLFIGGGNEYKIADIKGKTIKEVKSDLKFETGNLLNPSEKLDAFHFRNWFDAIRKGTKLNSGIVDACISTQLVQLGNIAQRVGHSLQIDPGSGRILNDLEANKLWGREYEKGWEIRV